MGFITIVIFIAVLSLLVFVHELGHFLTARRFGIGVSEFGFGLPPRAIGMRKKNGKWQIVKASEPDSPEQSEMIWSLNWIPLGGFVKIKGENGEERDQTDSFGAKPVWQRIIVLAAGVIMNTLLCIILLSIGFMVGMPSVVDDSSSATDRQVHISSVVVDSPAKQAGVLAGDRIITVDGQAVVSASQLRDYISQRPGQSLELGLKRGDDETAVTVAPAGDYCGTGENCIGVQLAETATVRYPFFTAIIEGVKATWIWTEVIVVSLSTALFNAFRGVPLGVDLAGPIGIAVLTGEATSLGIVYLLQFIALLSLNLAIINIAPFPALDGGRIVFAIVEKIRGRAVKQQWENAAHNIGFALLMLLVVVVTWRDVLRYGDGWLVAIRSMFGL